MAKYTFYFDGSYVKASQEVIEVFNPGQQRLHGVFETMRVVNIQVESIDEHLDRLIDGLKILKLEHPFSKKGIKQVLYRVIKKNPMVGVARARVMVFEFGGTVHLVVMLLPYNPTLKDVLKVGVIKTSRRASASHARVKSLDYSIFADAFAQAKADGYDEALLVNSKGYVFEASRANVFIFVDGALYTPPLSSGCLDGVVRRQVIKTARSLKILVVEKNLTPAMIKNAQHAFLTNSLAGLTLFDYN